MQSPLTNTENTTLIQTIKTKKICEAYKSNFGIDVSRFFKDISEIFLYQCNQTGYKFYAPSGIDGDGAFYEKLQKFDWYYMKEKWEHTKALEVLTASRSVLEVGCAEGVFVERMNSHGIKASGIELNEHAAAACQTKGLKVHSELMDVHAAKNSEKYDAVVSFQVVEHIADVGSFIGDMLKAVKSGGLLLISVPNNRGFLQRDDFGLLNMPPHHMGQWDEKSLRSLADIYPMDAVSVFKEPLQKYHFSYWYEVTYGKHFRKIPLTGKLLNKLIYMFVAMPFLYAFAGSVAGHTIMAVYKKK